MALLLWLNREAFCVPLRSISRVKSTFPPHGEIISDKGPTLIGAAVLDPVSKAIVAYTQLTLPFEDPNNLYQNIGEYQGHILALILYRLHKLEFSYSRLAYTGDNVSALSWLDSNKCKSLYGQTTNMVLSWFHIYAHIDSVNTSRIPGDEMGIIDQLSRQDHLSIDGLDHSLFIATDTPSILALFNLCAPSSTDTQSVRADNHHVIFERVHNILRDIFPSS